MTVAVTEIVIAPGAAPVHVTVCDQAPAPGEAGEPLPPADVSWALDPSLAGVTVAPDATGFDFSAPAGVGDLSGTATATYTPNGVTGALGLTVAITVTALTFTSP